MKRLLLIALLLIVGCSEKSVDKTTLFKKDEPIYGGQKKLPGKFIKASLSAQTTGAGQEPSLTIDRIVSQPSITGTAPSLPLGRPTAANSHSFGTTLDCHAARYGL